MTTLYEISVVISCLLVHILVFRNFFSTIFHTQLESKPSTRYDLIVGILSARENFNLRQAQRETWVGLTKNNSTISQKTLVRFVISNQPCMVPPEYRITPYHCVEKFTNNLVLNKELVSYTTPVFQPEFYTRGPIGRDFDVVHPIVITSVGISKNSLWNGTVVRLYDRVTKTEIINATFNVDEPVLFQNGNIYKTVPHFILPEGFRGTIVCENFYTITDTKCNDPKHFIQIDDGGGLISTRQVKRFGEQHGEFPEDTETIHNKRCPFTTATFTYKSHESTIISEKERIVRNEEWKKLKNNEHRKLQRESKLHSDILFVQNIDVYIHLPSQLLQFYLWVFQNLQFRFLLKTDDDCFVNIEHILKVLHKSDLKSKSKIWWSRFRSEWLVERYGKWAEPDYPGVTYPMFACGSGYVISADIVEWLAKNADSLKRYQGEDVSMGIWLSALGPDFIIDHRWSCFEDCTSEDIFTLPEQDTESLRDMWDNLKTCNNPCYCGNT